MTASSDHGKPSRGDIQNLYIRICRDSGWRLDYARAAHLAGKVGGFHAMDVWTAIPSLQVMEQIATGKHPVCLPPSQPRTNALGVGGAA